MLLSGFGLGSIESFASSSALPARRSRVTRRALLAQEVHRIEPTLRAALDRLITHNLKTGTTAHEPQHLRGHETLAFAPCNIELPALDRKLDLFDRCPPRHLHLDLFFRQLGDRHGNLLAVQNDRE